MKIKDVNTEDNVKRREQIKVQVFQPWSNFVCKIKSLIINLKIPVKRIRNIQNIKIDLLEYVSSVEI